MIKWRIKFNDGTFMGYQTDLPITQMIQQACRTARYAETDVWEVTRDEDDWEDQNDDQA